MFANFLIGLREGLEAGLIVGILVAYLKKLGRTDVLPRLWIGIGASIVMCLGIGALLTWGPYAIGGATQELVIGVLSIIAVGLVTWMIFWMGRNARELKTQLHSRLDAAVAGMGMGIVVLGFVAVAREGVETALFVWANVSASDEPVLGTIGALLGIVTSIAIAWLIYRGLVRINLGRFFTWTGLFLIIVAAGVLASGIHALEEAGVVPGGDSIAWSLEAVMPRTSWYGALLSGLFNYRPEPSWNQVIAWILYVAVVTILFLRQVSSTKHTPARREAAVPTPAA